VRPLDAAKLFARMREPFPSTIIGKAKNGSFRVFGLGRVDKSDVRVRSLKALYDARTKENGQRRRAVIRADHETGYVVAPKAMLGEKPAGKGVSDTRESTGKNGATPTRVKEGAGSRPLSAVKKETRTPAQIAAAQYKDEWSMFSDTTWAPNLRLTNAGVQLTRFPGQPLQHLLIHPSRSTRTLLILAHRPRSNANDHPKMKDMGVPVNGLSTATGHSSRNRNRSRSRTHNYLPNLLGWPLIRLNSHLTLLGLRRMHVNGRLTLRHWTNLVARMQLHC